MPDPETLNDAKSSEVVCRRHLRFGWWSLLVFLSLGLVLEALHGLKVGWYLNVSNEARRLMWTLAHTHGTLLSLVNIAFALTVRAEAGVSKKISLASPLLRAATILLPGGFFLGGAVIYGGDPGLGVLLVPIGGLVLLCAVFLVASSIERSEGPERPSTLPKQKSARKKRR